MNAGLGIAQFEEKLDEDLAPEAVDEETSQGVGDVEEETPFSDLPISNGIIDDLEYHLNEIYEAENICREKESVVESIKIDLKEAKDEFDAAVIRLRSLSRKPPEAKSLPLFDGPNAPANQPPNPGKPDPDLWKSVSIVELELGDALNEKLESAGVATIGQLEDLRGEIANHKAEWPKGIGAGKITKIENAVMAWLAKRAAENSVDVPVTKFSEFSTAQERYDYFESLADKLEKESLDPRDDGQGAESWSSGYAAGDLHHCPYDVAGVDQTEWCKGWLKSQEDAAANEKSKADAE